MASTSEANKPFDPLEQVTPFFNRAQLYAFAQPPSPEALGRVNRGGSHDYLPQEYVRALLDRFIGQGRWAIRASLVKLIDEKIQKGGKENIAVTAIVNVELDILSKTDPDKRLTYAGIGTHTMEAGADKGIAAAAGNAITSAESKGLKAAAKNLGKAFGNDLKNKLDRNSLPPSIQAYAKILADKNRAAEAASAPSPAPEVVADSGAVAETAAEPATVRETRPAPRQEPEQERRQSVRSDEDRGDDARATPREEPKAARHEEPRREEPREERQQTRERRPEPVAQAERAPANDAAREDGARDRGTSGAGSSAEEQSRPVDEKPVARVWELSMDPGSNYDDWIACIQTMASRINAMTNAREIESFVKRYNKRIKDLPQIPAEGENKAKDFKRHFRRIVAKKYQTLGLEVPEQYAEPAAAAA